MRGPARRLHFSLAIISVTIQLWTWVFWVISVYFNIRNTLPKSGTFLLGHPVYPEMNRPIRKLRHRDKDYIIVHIKGMNMFNLAQWQAFLNRFSCTHWIPACVQCVALHVSGLCAVYCVCILAYFKLYFTVFWAVFRILTLLLLNGRELLHQLNSFQHLKKAFSVFECSLLSPHQY